MTHPKGLRLANETYAREGDALELNADPPFRYCKLTNKVFGKNRKIGGDTTVCDIRGWGYLTGQGHGALALDAEDARRIQERTGEKIAALLNAKTATMKDDDQGEAQCKVCNGLVYVGDSCCPACSPEATQFIHSDPKVNALLGASDDLGFWLSGALEDQNVCGAMKMAINSWFDAIAALKGGAA